MTQPLVQLGRTDLWNLIFDQTLVIDRPPNTFLSTPSPYIIQSAITSHLLLVHCRSNEERAARWIRGCVLSQLVPVGQSSFGQNLAIVATKPVMQFVPTLVHFPRYSSDYFVRINLYKWFSELDVQIWEYTGTVSDTTADMLKSINTNIDIIYSLLSSSP